MEDRNSFLFFFPWVIWPIIRKTLLIVLYCDSLSGEKDIYCIKQYYLIGLLMWQSDINIKYTHRHSHNNSSDIASERRAWRRGTCPLVAFWCCPCRVYLDDLRKNTIILNVQQYRCNIWQPALFIIIICHQWYSIIWFDLAFYFILLFLFLSFILYPINQESHSTSYRILSLLVLLQ